MKIAINALILKQKNTGIGIYVSCLLQELLHFPEHEFTVFVPDKAFFSVNMPNVRVVELKFAAKNSLCRIFAEQFLLAGYVKKINPDILHSLSFVIPFSVRGVIQVVTVHDMFHETCVHTISPLKRLYYALFFNQSIRKADGIIAVSQSTKNDIIRLLGIPPQKIAVTYLGLRPTFINFVETPDIKTQFAALKLPERYALFVGSLEPRKNLFKLLAAFSHIKDKTDIKLVITGISASQKKHLCKKIYSFGLQHTVVYTDYIEETVLPLLYKNALLFVMPSLYEGFGLPVLEAMSMGTPVIVSDNSSLNEIALDAALTINPLDEFSIAEALLHLSQDKVLRYTLCCKGFEVLKKYTWLNTASETMCFYHMYGKEK